MITIYAVVNDQIVNRKFYKNSTEQTRDHFIFSLRRYYRNLKNNADKLELINEYRRDFVFHNRIPFDDDFYFVVENQFLEGFLYSDDFYSFEFTINSAINLTILYPDDNRANRIDFINEVKFYLKNYEYFNEYDWHITDIENFINEDCEIIYTEKHKLSMRKEDD